MKLRLLILLAAALAASPAAGQTVKSLGFNTTNGQVVYSGTNQLTFTNSLQFATNARAATRTNLGLGATWLTNTNVTNFRTEIGLGASSSVQFDAITTAGIGVGVGATSSFTVDESTIEVALPIEFALGSAAGTRTNLGLGATWLTNTDVTNFRTAIGLGATNNVTFSNITTSGTLAVTGNVTLSGVDNLAAQQTASSGASLMTRDLVDNNPLWSLGSVRVLGSYATNNSGTASSTSVIGFGSSQLVSGTATNGYARSSLLSSLNLTPATGNGINLSQSISVAMTFGTINTSSENAIRLVVGGNGGVPAPANSNAITGRGFGVEITRDGVTAGEANLRLFSHDGTNYTTSSFSTNFTMTSARQMQLLLTKGTNGVVQLFFSHAAASKAPSRPSTTPLLTLSNGPSGTAAGAFIDLVTVNNSTSAPVNANTLYFYNGMVEVKD